ncbi:hypothetical protein PENNAL_c0001G02448 [Penicillium nalgiovense]|uniref:Uncharacterized protein n=1 Tax=Penicillium nalgiovense TaxID=60175 RepID=A0A1V6Z942_PENNA|nr:hypothetical protein PENNAL_c0001G02448 [Penicillium nalgiovense]
MELNRSLQASRVVCISGLLTGIKTTNNENALGLAADPVWGGKSFERILVKQAEDLLQTIKEEVCDYVATFKVDPCALAQDSLDHRLTYACACVVGRCQIQPLYTKRLPSAAKQTSCRV